MTTRLYLIRHGSTQLTAEDRFSGAANVFLSEEGRAQAPEGRIIMLRRGPKGGKLRAVVHWTEDLKQTLAAGGVR